MCIRDRRRGAQKLTYRSRFLLVGSMNPEEGDLRPQLMDRFGLRVIVRGLRDTEERYQAYEQAMWYKRDAEGMAGAYSGQTLTLAGEIEAAQTRLPQVTISPAARRLGLALIHALEVASNRAEITLFEAARAHAAADERNTVTAADIGAVALLALRFRQSSGIKAFLEAQEVEEDRVRAFLEKEAAMVEEE